MVNGYVDAWERNDVETVVAMLTEDATFAMPPLASWFRGREAIAAFLADWPLSGSWQWRVVHARANGQPALAYYAWDADEGSHLPFALNVLTLRGRRISDRDRLRHAVDAGARARGLRAMDRAADRPVEDGVRIRALRAA